MLAYFLFIVQSALGAGPSRAYVNESSLATKLETQVEVVASPSSFSLPPLPSKWGAAVFESVMGGEVDRNPAGAAGETGLAFPVGGVQPAAQALRAALRSPMTAFDVLERGAGNDLVAKSRVAQDSMEMLLVALDAKGEGKAVLASIVAKGAVAKWNELVGAAVKKWEALSKQRTAAPPPELAAIESFFESGNAREIHGVLNAFRTN